MAKYSTVKRYRDEGKSLHNPDSKEYKLVQEYMSILEYCYERYKPTLERLQKLHNIYDNAINETLFPTISKMAIPNHFGMVQEALPNALDYVWPDAIKTYELSPVDVDVELETLDKVEYALNYMVRQRMKAKWATLPAIQNAIKTGIGYAAVVPTVVTPPATLNKRFIQGGRVVASTRQVGLGKPMKTLKIENIGLGEIIPSDDGSDFNGHSPVSYVFRVKMYSENAFRRLMKKIKADTEDIKVKGDAEAIIQQADAFNFTTNVPLPEIIANLGGVDIQSRPLRGAREFIMVPVIQCYGENEHVWVANGTTVIYHEKDSLQTLHRPLLKACVTIDNSKWHPMNPAEAGATISNGKNLYANLLMDMIIRATKPYMVYDKGRFGNKAPVVGPNGEIGVDGVVQGAIDFPSGPRMDNGHVAFDNMLDRMYGHAVGQGMNQMQMSPGMMRGGLHAFESLLNTMYGRQRLASMVLDMGFVEPLGKLTMMYMQLMAENQGMTFNEREYDSDTGKERIKYTNVTYDDLNAAYDVSVDSRVKTRTVTELNERLQMWGQVYKDNPFIDQYTALQMTIGDYNASNKLLPSRERSRQMQEQNRQAEMQQMQAAPPEGEAPAGVPGGIGGTAETIAGGAGL